MFTLFYFNEYLFDWVDCGSFPSCESGLSFLKKELKVNNNFDGRWYVRPDDREAEVFLTKHNLI